MSFSRTNTFFTITTFRRAAVVFLMLACPASAREYAHIPPDRFLPLSIVEESDVNFIPYLGSAVEKLGSALDSGDNLAVSLQMEAIEGWKERLGSENLFFVSKFLLIKAKQLARSGHPERGVQTAKDAETISPDDYSVKLAIARLAFALNKSNVKGYLAPAALAPIAFFKDSRNRLAVINSVLRFLIPAVVVAFVIFVFTSLAVYGRLLISDVLRVLPAGTGSKTAILIALFALSAAFLVGGVIVTALTALLFIAGYRKPRERLVVFVFVIFLTALPMIADFSARYVAMEDSKLYRAVGHYLSGNWEPASYAKLTEVGKAEPDNTELIFALANLDRNLGNTDRAEQRLDKLLEKNPRHVRAMNELANNYFQQKEYRQAELTYIKAIDISPKLAELHYNLGKTYLEQFRTEEANREFGVSMQLDRKKTEGFVKREGDEDSARVVSFTANIAKLPTLEMEIEHTAARITSAMWPVFAGDFKRVLYYAGAVVYIALLLLLGAILRRAQISTSCSSCNDVFVPAATAQGGGGDNRCNQCLVLSSSRQKVLRSKKERKLTQIKNYHYNVRRRSNILNFIFPGLGNVYAGRYASGAVILCLSSVFIVKLLYILSPLMAGYASAISAVPSMVYMAWGATMAVFYLFSALALRIEA